MFFLTVYYGFGVDEYEYTTKEQMYNNSAFVTVMLSARYIEDLGYTARVYNSAHIHTVDIESEDQEIGLLIDELIAKYNLEKIA